MASTGKRRRALNYLAAGSVSLCSLAVGYYAYCRHGEKSHQFNAWSTGEQAIDNKDLTGKTAIVTGCNTGIGKETVRVLVKQGCNVIMACRSEGKANEARNDILNDLSLPTDYEKLSVSVLDLSSLDSIEAFAFEFNQQNVQLDYLINNAAALITHYKTSKDGFEMQFGVNHLGHFYLTNLLAPSLLLAADSNERNGIGQKPRVINVSSLGEVFSVHDYQGLLKKINAGIKESTFYPSSYIEDKYDAIKAYGETKTANILFSRELSKRFDNKITSVSLHPGSIFSTDLTRNIKNSVWDILKTNVTITKGMLAGGLYFPHQYIKLMTGEIKNIPQGAATTLRLVSLSDMEIKDGSFYTNCRPADDLLRGPASKDTSGQMAKKLWELSETLLEAKGKSVKNVN